MQHQQEPRRGLFVAFDDGKLHGRVRTPEAAINAQWIATPNEKNRICDFIQLSGFFTVGIPITNNVRICLFSKYDRMGTSTSAAPRPRARSHRHVCARHRAYTPTQFTRARWPLPLREREAAATPHGALAPRPWMERVRCPSPTARMTARRACACLSRCSGVWAPAPSLTFARPHAAFRSNPLLADLCTMDLSPLH